MDFFIFMEKFTIQCNDLITLNLISVDKISQRGGEREEEENKLGRGRNQTLGSAWLYC